MSERREHGFTLIEVMIAFFLGAMVFGFLTRAGAMNVRRIGDARERQAAFQLAEHRAREVQLDLAGGGLREGSDTGEFDAPDDAYGWEVLTEPLRLPLPPSYDEDALPSPLFEAPEGSRQLEADPVAFLVQVRVFRLDDPEEADLTRPPLRFVAVEPGQPAPQGAAGAAQPRAADQEAADRILERAGGGPTP